MTRPIVVATLIAVLVVAAVVYRLRTPPDRMRDVAPSASKIVMVTAPIASPFVMFRSLTPDQFHGRVAMMTIAGDDVNRYVTPLSCTRLHYGGGTGICVVERAAFLFDRSFTRGQAVELAGIVTRARVSPDGRRVALSVYAEQHQPDGSERLATESFVIDVATGASTQLREFTIDPSGGPAVTAPIDISSVSFAGDSDRFYAAVSSGSSHIIVEGRLSTRQLRVVHRGALSEALSPDGSQLIVKKSTSERTWQLYVLDLQTLVEQRLNQGPDGVDDQVDWLDAAQVIYHDATEHSTGLWSLPTDGINTPRLLVGDGYSPSVQR
ncbi:MAG TPA: hypothetical protein VNJ02_00625 [Vicinamibacterales bacterium]|nr:hypothetical protein [Vicinamibacterales bacterium]